MNRRRLCRASLKITRYADRGRTSQFRIEVWNPFRGEYQLADSVQNGVKRVGELADLIGRMWMQRHPKRDILADVPDAVDADQSRWAEFRINATTFRSYDTRYDDRPTWARVTGMVLAAETICTRVGYAMSVSEVL
jgi:hypothetical protein